MSTFGRPTSVGGTSTPEGPRERQIFCPGAQRTQRNLRHTAWYFPPKSINAASTAESSPKRAGAQSQYMGKNEDLISREMLIGEREQPFGNIPIRTAPTPLRRQRSGVENPKDPHWNEAGAPILNHASLRVPTWGEKKMKKNRSRWPDRRSHRLERRRRVGLVGRQRSGGERLSEGPQRPRDLDNDTSSGPVPSGPSGTYDIPPSPSRPRASTPPRPLNQAPNA
ncbi:hypothetical protein HPB52_012520 [Rhipicephalus sanguineus]|uniref:Uncharacterized protein n=1 Tax=Rhipicephalus sanguineus TaxID=34632 RepID=A0A9D4SWA8_RHISA|nr:hypothetical protein HPB52_012520 [Rhipicephalus sanguineus]